MGWAVIGYKKDVNWMDSMVLDLLFLYIRFPFEMWIEGGVEHQLLQFIGSHKNSGV
jgi:hypothetical protein